MKLFALLSLFSVASAFALTPAPLASRLVSSVGAEREAPIAKSPLARNPELVRGGAVPGWAAYNQALEEHPLPAKAATSLVGWALGDLLTQMFISTGPFDVKRFISFSAFGFLYHGPSGHYFYNFLDKLIPGKTATAVASKVAFDQIVWCPIFVCVFFTYLGLVNGDSFATIGQKIQTDLLAACQGSWKVWPFVHAVNFAFISNKHRLLFLNAVQVAFNMFLSIMGAK